MNSRRRNLLARTARSARHGLATCCLWMLAGCVWPPDAAVRANDKPPEQGEPDELCRMPRGPCLA